MSLMNFKKHGLTLNIPPKYTLYTYDKIINEIKEASKEASEILELSPENCKILLHHFKWNSMNLSEKFFEASSLKSFIEKNRIKYILEDSVNEDTVTVDKCKICKEIKDVAILSCSHLLCFDCWESSICLEKENLEGVDILPYLTCNVEGCNAPVPEAFTLQLFHNPETYHFFQHMTIQSFIQTNPSFKWCPNKSNGCNLAVKINGTSEVQEINCECGFTYCFSCNDIPHSPFPCILIQKWKAEMEFREKTVNNFKCSFCSAYIVTTSFIGTVICKSCEKDCNISDLSPIKSDDYGYFYLEQTALLQKEFQQLAALEKINNQSLEFLKTSLKLLTHFRQKSLYFYAYCHYLKNGQIFAKFQSELRSLMNIVTNLFPAINEKTFDVLETFNITTDKETKIHDVLVKIESLIKSQYKSFYEDDWKFKDKEIEKAMKTLKY